MIKMKGGFCVLHRADGTIARPAEPNVKMI